MKEEAVLSRIMEHISEIIESDQVEKDSELVNDLDMSSLEIFSLIAELEEEFHIKIQEKEIRKIRTPQDIQAVIMTLQKG